MSTRANIILKDGDESMIFYRHSDGYPDGALPPLKKFVDLMKSGALRDNIGQAAGWIIILGGLEYNSIPKPTEVDEDGSPKTRDAVIVKDWKCGAMEPTTCIHGDIEYLYLVDLGAKTIVGIEIPEEQDWKSSKVIEKHY